ncbi:diguanylate cyclase [Candidatus Gracilibacteria bacterium]|nr:diguanylate cyclase [Candidatus Gracilibacteria bacterium]
MNTLDLESQLVRLRAMYAAQLPNRLAQLNAAIDALCAQPEDEAAQQALYRVAHRLAGSGSAMGMPLLSSAAFALVQLLDNLPPAQARGGLFAFQLRSYAAAMAISINGAPRTMSAPSAVETYAVVEQLHRLTQVAVIARDNEDFTELPQQLSHFGYQAVRCRIDEIPSDTQAYAALVVELDELANAGHEPARRAKLPAVPIIATSARSDMAARLQALRLGVESFLPQPFAIGVLVETLDRITMRLPSDAPRVLIVDDSYTAARIHKAILEAAGMVAEIVLDPLAALEPLADFAPDLLLVDLYMPGCTGLELAAVVRQQAEYVSLPIVFLSTETDRAIQLAALADVGDDFLTKPVIGSQLVTAIIARVARARALRAQISRDGLTGLLNHATILAQLAHEVERAQRCCTPLSVALLDIDHFKQVNDTYGHQAGDRVLKSLARALQQRLRASDGIGRYGGEEFLVVMPGADAPAARRVLDDVRERFAQIHHHDGPLRWSTTFSAGIVSSDLPVASLINGADAALYTAKRRGRNRIVCYNSNE